MLERSYPYYLANQPQQPNADLIVTDKYTCQPATMVAMADRQVIESAITAAAAAADPMRKMPAYKRREVLNHVADRLTARHQELAEVLCIEAGKPIRDARGEVTRAIDTFRIGAEESVRLTGEYLPLDISPRAEGYEGITKRVPVGPCSFICPFNFPINLAAHKIAPAVAVGCPFVLKPAPQTPISSVLLGEILAETDLPAGAFSIVPCSVDDAAALVQDDRIKLLSFTGSSAVGWQLKAEAGKKKVLLELGGNAACVVDRDADLDEVLPRLIFGAFYQSGQSCISVQRILAHQDIAAQLTDRLVEEAGNLKAGDPREESTFLGPMISEEEAIRVELWVKEAASAGAKVLCGGERHGVFYDATVVTNVPRAAKISCREVFGPVVTVEAFRSFGDACATINDSAYGLQAGVFTRDIHDAFYAFDQLQVGAVIINDIPSMRVDSMPYGGVKDSGLGREGVRYAMDEMTELRLMVLTRTGRGTS